MSKGAHASSWQTEHVPLPSGPGLGFARLCVSGLSNGSIGSFVARFLPSSRQSAWLVAGVTGSLDPSEHEPTTSSILSGVETPSEHIGFSLNSPSTFRRRPTTSRNNSEFRSASGMGQSIISFSPLPPLLSCMQGGPCPTRQMLST